jgi:hypothetical protein
VFKGKTWIKQPVSFFNSAECNGSCNRLDTIWDIIFGSIPINTPECLAQSILLPTDKARLVTQAIEKSVFGMDGRTTVLIDLRRAAPRFAGGG